MKNRNLILVLLLAAVAVLAAVLLRRPQAGASAALLGRPVLADFDLSRVARVEIGDKLVLAAGAEGWQAESNAGYPVDRQRLVRALMQLRELKVGQVARGRELGSETKVTLKDEAGAVLAELRLGDRHFAKAGGQNRWGGPDGRYLAFDGQTVLVTDALSAFDGELKNWVDTRILRLEDRSIDFETIVDPSVSEATLGFATGTVQRVTALEGTNRVERTVRLGNVADAQQSRYFRLDGQPWTFTIPAYAAESLLKAETEPPQGKEQAQ